VTKALGYGSANANADVEWAMASGKPGKGFAREDEGDDGASALCKQGFVELDRG
jgi:hypothetical protein